MINKDLMRQWITTLRSRKYKQGQEVLRRKGETRKQVDRFCCLGVLCDMVDPSGWVLRDARARYDYRLGSYNEDEFLPPDLAEEIGLSLEEQRTLAKMNDDGYKFHEIADYLERTYLREY